MVEGQNREKKGGLGKKNGRWAKSENKMVSKKKKSRGKIENKNMVVNEKME